MSAFLLHFFALSSLASAELWEGGPRLAAIGDVDGDGISELAAAFPAGLEVFSGASGCSLRSWRLEGADRSVWTVAPAGDVDGDGRADLAFSVLERRRRMPRFMLSSGSGRLRGQVEVVSVHDGRSVLAFPERGTLSGAFGYALDGGQDFDLDGTPDLVVTSPGDRDAMIRVVSGSTGKTVSAWSLDSLRPDPSGALDHEGAPIPDEELFVGITVRFAEAIGSAGAEIVVRSGLSTLALGPGGRRRASSTPAYVGDLSPVDDLTGDGVAELVGGYTILDGDSLDVLMHLSHMHTDPWGASGHWTTGARLGDVDGDGGFEFVVANADALVLHRWMACFSSKSDEPTWVETTSVALESREPDEAYGFTVAGLEDVDGDGARDFAALRLASRKLVVRSGRRPDEVVWSISLQ